MKILIKLTMVTLLFLGVGVQAKADITCTAEITDSFGKTTEIIVEVDQNKQITYKGPSTSNLRSLLKGELGVSRDPLGKYFFHHKVSFPSSALHFELSVSLPKHTLKDQSNLNGYLRYEDGKSIGLDTSLFCEYLAHQL